VTYETFNLFCNEMFFNHFFDLDCQLKQSFNLLLRAQIKHRVLCLVNKTRDLVEMSAMSVVTAHPVIE